MIVSKTKKWGNSLGIIVPAEEVRNLGLKEDEEVIIQINKSENPLKELFNFGENNKIGIESFKDFRKELESKWA